MILTNNFTFMNSYVFPMCIVTLSRDKIGRTKKEKRKKNLSTTHVCLVNNIPRQQKENLTQLEATYNDKLGKTKKEG